MNAQEELKNQYTELMNGCGIVPTDRTIIEVGGSDRASFLHNFCTNDIKKLKSGEGCEAFVTTVQGKTIGHAFFLVHDESITVNTVSGQGESLFAHLDRYLITEDVELRDASSQYSSSIVSGQSTGDVAERLGIVLPKSLYQHYTATVSDVEFSVCRVDMTNSPTLLLTVEQSLDKQLLRLFLESGAKLCAEAALDVARVEHGFPYFGPDIKADNLPQEVDRNDLAISFTKGCYLGQETVARLDALGHVNRVMRIVSIDQRDVNTIPESGQKLIADGKTVGTLGTVTRGLDHHTLICLAFLRVQHAETGTQINTDIGTLKVLSDIA